MGTSGGDRKPNEKSGKSKRDKRLATGTTEEKGKGYSKNGYSSQGFVTGKSPKGHSNKTKSKKTKLCKGGVVWPRINPLIILRKKSREMGSPNEVKSRKRSRCPEKKRTPLTELNRGKRVFNKV